jgi:hypothetical protein
MVNVNRHCQAHHTLCSEVATRGGPLVRARNRHQTRVLVDCLVDWAGC